MTGSMSSIICKRNDCIFSSSRTVPISLVALYWWFQTDDRKVSYGTISEGSKGAERRQRWLRMTCQAEAPSFGF
jgi:hypothetical protein